VTTVALNVAVFAWSVATSGSISRNDRAPVISAHHDRLRSSRRRLRDVAADQLLPDGVEDRVRL